MQQALEHAHLFEIHGTVQATYYAIEVTLHGSLGSVWIAIADRLNDILVLGHCIIYTAWQ
jgi:hypothetical protein